MRHTLLLLLVLLLASCGKQTHQLLDPAPSHAPVLQAQQVGALPDSLPARRLFGLLPAATGKKSRTKLKNVTINHVVGQGNNLSNAGDKPQGPIAQAAPGATQQQAASTKGPATSAGHDAVPPPPSKPPAEHSDWLNWLLAGIAVGFAIRQFGPWLLRKLVPVVAVVLVCSLSAQAGPRPPRYRTMKREHDKAERQATREYARIVRYYKARNRQREREKRRLAKHFRPDPRSAHDWEGR